MLLFNYNIFTEIDFRGKVTPERILEYLQKSQKVNTAGCTVPVQRHLTSLIQDLPNAEAFMSKYNDLKDKKYKIRFDSNVFL